MAQIPGHYHGHYWRWGKRFFDLLLSTLALIFLLPILGLVALWVRLDSRGPIFFNQTRFGRHAKCFEVYKFRTMLHKPRVTKQEIIGHDTEITRVGYWLRRFKIDEMPQLLNVFKGDMSIVGPRPALPIPLENYDENGKKRLLVRPGLTGLAQINGNIHLTWLERWRYDAQYVDNLSLWLDLQIIYRTVAVVILGERRFYKLQESENLRNKER